MSFSDRESGKRKKRRIGRERGAVYFDDVRMAASASSVFLGLPSHVTALGDYVVYFLYNNNILYYII